MDLAALKAELIDDPLHLGYAEFLPHAPGSLADMPNRVRDDTQAVQDTWLTDRGMVAEIVPQYGLALCDSVLAKLEQAGAASKSVGRIVQRLYNDALGINFGDAALRAMIGAWSGNLLTAEESGALLALSEKPASRAMQLGFPVVRELDVIDALATGE